MEGGEVRINDVGPSQVVVVSGGRASATFSYPAFAAPLGHAVSADYFGGGAVGAVVPLSPRAGGGAC